MKRAMGTLLFLAFGLGLTAETTVSYGKFGRVTLYPDLSPKSELVLFVSGDGGWNLGVVDMARSLAGLDALVAGIDIPIFLDAMQAGGEKCAYPAADFEALSKFIQAKAGFPQYRPPILVGYSSGATLVYALLVQAPPGTFKGAMSLGFCPDLPLTKPLCRGAGLESEPGPKGKGYNFLPAPNLKAPWVAFQGAIDQVCSPSFASDYAGKVDGARLVGLPKVGHGFSVQRNWMPQFKEAYQALVSAPAPVQSARASDVDGLPLVEVPARGEAADDTFAVVLSGDGGWASLDRDIGDALSAAGVPVAGFDSLQYFWKRRTPDEAGRDLERVLRHYLAAWKKERVLLAGYSLGADVLPFMASRLPKDLRNRVALYALLAPSPAASFEFHLTDWLGGAGRESDLPTLPEVRKLEGGKVLCLYGDDDKGSLCPQMDPAKVGVKMLKGGHHFGGDYKGIAAELLARIR